MARLNKKNLKHKKLAAILVIIVLLGAGYWIYGQAASYTNKRDFQQARSTIDIIYNQIVKQVGAPDNSKRDSSCSRSYQEFNGYVSLSCDVDTSFVYPVQSKDNAQLLINKIQDITNKESTNLKPTKPISTSIVTTGVLTTNYYGAQNFYKYGSLDCTSKYSYDTPSETFLKLKHSAIPLFVVIGCTGPAKKQYYPLNQ